MNCPKFKNGMIVFSDSLKYTVDESLFLSKDSTLTDHDIECIHMVKKLFDGMILTGNETFYDKRIKPTFHKFKKSYKKAIKDELDRIGESFGNPPIMAGNALKDDLALKKNQDNLQLTLDL